MSSLGQQGAIPTSEGIDIAKKLERFGVPNHAYLCDSSTVCVSQVNTRLGVQNLSVSV